MTTPEQKGPFKRLNFFPGFFTTAKDWNDGEDYHLEKRKLHNRGLHSPGVFNEDEQPRDKWTALQVTKVSNRKVKVTSGIALDPDGNLIYLHSDTTQELPDDILTKCKGDNTIYVAIKFVTSRDPGDQVTGEYSGFTRLTEEPKIVFPCDPSDDKLAVRLAKIKLKRDAPGVEVEGEPEDIREPASARGLEQTKSEVAALDKLLNSLNGQVDKNLDLHVSDVANLRGSLTALHSPGVFNEHEQPDDSWKTLQVTKEPDGRLKVAPGAALDSDGNRIYLHEPAFIDIEMLSDIAKRCKADDTVYVAITIDTTTESDDPVMGECSGVTRLTEKAKIVFPCDPSDDKMAVRLARIKLKRNAHGVEVEGEPEDKRELASARGLEQIKSKVASLNKLLNTLNGQVDKNLDLHVSDVASLRGSLTALHSPGVFNEHEQPDDSWKTLQVTKELDGRLKVAPGAALDSDGNRIYLHEPAFIDIEMLSDIAKRCKADDTVYVAITIDTTTESDDPVMGECSGVTRLTEKAKIVFPCDPSDDKVAVRLARIKLKRNAHGVEIEGEPEDIREPAGAKGLEQIKKEVAILDDSLNSLNGQVGKNLDLHLNDVANLHGSLTLLNYLVGQDRQRHDHSFHTPGILHEQMEDLEIEAYSGLQVRIRRGMALDALGRLIEVTDERKLVQVPPPHQPDCAYIVVEADTPPGHNSNALAYPAKITVQYRKPSLAEGQIELARIQMQPGTTQITRAEHADRPGINEIDRTQVMRAGAFDRATQDRLQILEEGLFERLYHYQLAARKRHNQGLHTPGIVPNVWNDLMVVALPKLEIQVQPGMAIDAEGNELLVPVSRTLRVEPPKHLPPIAYVVIRHRTATSRSRSDYGTLFTADDEPSDLDIQFRPPDNQSEIELARIQLLDNLEQQGISNPDPSSPPGGNQIDRSFITWAGAALRRVPETLPSESSEKLIAQLHDNRRDFASLTARFPTPSLDDVRHAVINLEMLARTQSLTQGKLPSALHMIAKIAADVVKEVGKGYPAVATRSEFTAFDAASERYSKAFTSGELLNELLSRQNVVAECARILSEVVFRRPVVRLNQSRYTVTAHGTSGTLTLNAEAEAFNQQRIVRYELLKRS